MMRHSPRRHSVRDRGTILIIAMIVLFAIAALVLTLGRSARTEALTAANARSSAEADAVERGAEQYAMATLASYATDLQDLNDDYFTSIQVGNGYFWIIRPNYNDDNISTYGLLDESAKLNLNSVTDDQLSYLPFMSSDLSGDIESWRGDTGTDGSSVSGLDESGVTKGQPFETVDEMRLLPSVTADLLYGSPSGTSAAGGTGTGTSNSNANSSASSGSDWYEQHGIFDYFTVWSTSSTTAADGTARVTIDPSDASDLNDLLNSKLGVGPVTLRGPEDIFQLATSLGLTEDQFAQIEDYVSTGVAAAASGTTLPPPTGLINPNFAAPETLSALGLSDDDVQQLISARANGAASYPNSLAWVYDTLGADAIGLGRYLTARGAQYSADIIATSGDGRSFKRVRVVIDTSATPIKIVYRRDITDRGWPLDAQLLSDLRSGKYKASHPSAVGGLTQ